MTDVIKTRREGGILEVTLDRPKATHRFPAPHEETT